MTKKDYQAIARAVYAVRETSTPQAAGSDGAGWALEQITVQLSAMLAADNPRFDRATFVAACEDGNVTRRPKRKSVQVSDDHDVRGGL